MLCNTENSQSARPFGIHLAWGRVKRREEYPVLALCHSTAPTLETIDTQKQPN